MLVSVRRTFRCLEPYQLNGNPLDDAVGAATLSPATWQLQSVRVKGIAQYTVQKLPLWGSWQGTALTDEGRGAALNIVKTMGAKVLRNVVAAICRQPAARPESWYVYICNSQTRNVCHLGLERQRSGGIHHVR